MLQEHQGEVVCCSQPISKGLLVINVIPSAVKLSSCSRAVGAGATTSHHIGRLNRKGVT